MTSTTPDPDRWPGPVAATARLGEERDILRAHIAQLADDMAGLVAASRDSNADDEHDPEGQTIAYERSQLSAVTHQARDHLQEIEAAIDRVAAGTYGVCAVCRRPVAAARLEAKPTARTCVHHVHAPRRTTS